MIQEFSVKLLAALDKRGLHFELGRCGHDYYEMVGNPTFDLKIAYRQGTSSLVFESIALYPKDDIHVGGLMIQRRVRSPQRPNSADRLARAIVKMATRIKTGDVQEKLQGMAMGFQEIANRLRK